jgi:hypothetical protein
MAGTNPFTERGRITETAHFAGRWSELSLIFERLEAGRPVLITGVAGVGKSSLLTHVVQSAAVNLELPHLRAFYFDIQHAENAADIYRTVAGALGLRNAAGQNGASLAALELALVAADDPILLALDNAHPALAAGWGDIMLESLARAARGGGLFLVVGTQGDPPVLSEPFAILRLGALAQPEVRLLIESYLGDDEVAFSPSDIRAVAELSAAHPAYVQRAAYHLYQSKIDPGYDWRTAYRVDVQSRPIPGAPLPPAVFEGAGGQSIGPSSYGDALSERSRASPAQLPLPEVPRVVALLAVVLLVATLIFAATRSLGLLLVVAVIGGAATLWWWRGSGR